MKELRFYVLIVVLLTLALSGPVLAQVSEIELGFKPEGTVIPFGHTLYIGSQIYGDLTISRANILTGEVSPLVVDTAHPGMALGLSYDSRTDYLFVAGGPSFPLRVYDAGTGELVHQYPLPTSTDCPGTGPPLNLPYFTNDVVVTSRGVYVSDSANPCIYKATLGPAGALPDELEIIKLALAGLPGPEGYEGSFPYFLPNGIEATSNGKQLYLVDSVGGGLYSIDPGNGEWTHLLGGLVGGDGLLLIGRTLYVTQNTVNNYWIDVAGGTQVTTEQVSVIELQKGQGAAQVVLTIPDSSLSNPATLAAFGPYLYVANAGANNVLRLSK